MSTSLMHHNYIMCPISSSQKENILSLASNGHSTCHIASSLGVSQPTVSRVLKDLLPNRDIPLSGHPSKLSPTSQHSMSHKSPWERLPMLSKPPNTSIPSSPPQSPHRQSEESSRNTHSRL